MRLHLSLELREFSDAPGLSNACPLCVSAILVLLHMHASVNDSPNTVSQHKQQISTREPADRQAKAS